MLRKPAPGLVVASSLLWTFGQWFKPAHHRFMIFLGCHIGNPLNLKFSFFTTVLQWVIKDHIEAQPPFCQNPKIRRGPYWSPKEIDWGNWNWLNGSLVWLLNCRLVQLNPGSGGSLAQCVNQTKLVSGPQFDGLDQSGF